MFDFTQKQLEENLDRILNAFGLAKRAGKCIVGTGMCVEEIRKGKAKLVICALDISDNTKKRLYDSCKFYNVPILNIPCTKDHLAKFFGKTNETSAACISDDGFLNIICKIFNETHVKHTEVHE